MHLTHRFAVPPPQRGGLFLSPFSVCCTKWKCTKTFYGSLSKVDAPKPSPLGRGDRSGAKFTEAQGELREAIAVGEIHHSDALSPNWIMQYLALRKPPRLLAWWLNCVVRFYSSANSGCTNRAR